MAELNAKLNCKKDGVTEGISVYTTLDEVQNQGIQIAIGGIDGYMKYGDIADENASQLNCKVGGITYKVHKTALAPASVTVTLRCFDVETEQQISALVYPVPGNGVLYLNNENAPSVAGYDFAMMDGIKHSGVVEDDVFDVWYISQSVPNRTLTFWVRYFSSTTDTTIVANTYSATSLRMACNNNANIVEVKRINTSNVTDMYSMFNNCSNLTTVPQMDTSNVTNISSIFNNCSNLTTVPQMDTSNVTNMRYMFNGCSSLTTIPQMDTGNVTDMYCMFQYCSNLTAVPQMDTSNVTNMYGMFYDCSNLTSIDWEIDMSSCSNCDYMFTRCPATNIRLKNVPSSLNLSSIGTTNYTVVNYI